MRLSEDIRAEGIAPLRNPLAGTLLTAPAGSRREIEFDVHNDSPNVAAFHLEVDAPVAEWTAGAGRDNAVVLAPSGSGALRLSLILPPGAAAGDYDFRVRAVTGSGLVMQETFLTLRVGPAAPETEALVLEGTALAAGQSALSLLPAAVPVPLGTPPVGSSKANDALDVIKADSRAVMLPVAAKLPTALAAASEIALTESDEADEEPLNFITLLRPEAGTDETNAPSETSVIDPREGASLPVRPGETLLVRFGFVNTGMQEITYILDEDRSLPQGWATLVQDQVNLTRNGSGEVSLRLTPPVTAEPGEYPFLVMYGLQGGVLTSRTLLLSVTATPAVRLTARQSRLAIGPLHRSARFALEVSSAGNADTAFRIAVSHRVTTKKETSEQTTLELPSDNMDSEENKEVYETEHWQYLFDRELDNLRSPAPNRPPQPVTIHLRLRRRGWWWLGMRESHRVRVTAVPVTEPENGGRPGNSVELTALRWRLLPFPAGFLAPLVLLLLILFAGQPEKIDVTSKRYYDKQQNIWYIVDPPGPDNYIALSWKAPPFALMRLEGQHTARPMMSEFRRGSGKFVMMSREADGSRMGLYHFTLSNIILLGAAPQEALIRCVNTSPATPLCVKVSINKGRERSWVGDTKHVHEVDDPEMAYKTQTFTSEPVENEIIRLEASPGDKIVLNLVNLALESASLNYTLANGMRNTAKMRFDYIARDGLIRWKNKNAPEVNSAVMPITVDASAPIDYSDDIVFVTTSTAFPVVKINIRVVLPPVSAGTAATLARPSAGAAPLPKGGSR